MRWGGPLAAAGLCLALVACGKDEAPAPGAAPGGARVAAPSGPVEGGKVDVPAPAAAPEGRAAAPSPPVEGDAAKGRQVWLGQCVACHNVDPGKDGPVGPAVKGASRALLEARVTRAVYPPGYTPKRETRVMPARPDLAPSVPDLAAFLR